MPGCIPACTSAGKSKTLSGWRNWIHVKPKKENLFFFFQCNDSLFPSTVPLINKRKGKPSFSFIDTFSLASILLLWKRTKKRGEATSLICSCEKRQEQRV